MSSIRQLSLIAVRLLEHFLEPVIGERTLDELRAATIDIEELRLRIQEALARAERDFLLEGNPDVAAGLLGLPLADLASVQEALDRYAQDPASVGELHRALIGVLSKDYPQVLPREIEGAVKRYTQLVEDRLISADSSIRDRLTGLAVLRISRYLEQQVSRQLPDAEVRRDSVFKGFVPPAPDRDVFLGRDEDVTNLLQRISALSTGPSRGVLAIRGWPGVGKTTLAAALVHEATIQGAYRDGIWWISLGPACDIALQLNILAEQLGHYGIGAGRNIEQISAIVAQDFSSLQSLVMLDDVYDAATALPFLKVLGPGCHVIFTTRFPQVVSDLVSDIHGRSYVLKPLSETWGLELLKRLAPQVVAAYPTEGLDLVRAVEGLPLALQVAGRALRQESQHAWGVRDLLASLTAGTALINQRPPGDRLLEIAHETNPSIASLLQLTIDRLDDGEKTYFAYLGALAPKPARFDVEVVNSIWKAEDPQKYLRRFVDLGLIEPVSDGYWMHALLVQYATWLLDNS